MYVMRPPRWKIFEFFDIPVYVDLTFLLLLFLFLNSGGSFSYGLMQALVLGLSIVAHEYGHALTGRAFGCATHDINLSMIGGCASMVSMPRRGWQEFLVALAGPLVSFALFGIGYFVYNTISIDNEFLRQTIKAIYRWNRVLGCFNLLPGFPMDGGRIFRNVMMIFTTRPKATFVAMWVGRSFAVLLALLGIVDLFFYHSGWAFVQIFIAYMIWKDGYREYQLALMESGWTYQDFRAKVSPPPYDR